MVIFQSRRRHTPFILCRARTQPYVTPTAFRGIKGPNWATNMTRLRRFLCQRFGASQNGSAGDAERPRGVTPQERCNENKPCGDTVTQHLCCAGHGLPDIALRRELGLKAHFHSSGGDYMWGQTREGKSPPSNPDWATNMTRLRRFLCQRFGASQNGSAGDAERPRGVTPQERCNENARPLLIHPGGERRVGQAREMNSRRAGSAGRRQRL